MCVCLAERGSEVFSFQVSCVVILLKGFLFCFCFACMLLFFVCFLASVLECVSVSLCVCVCE